MTYTINPTGAICVDTTPQGIEELKQRIVLSLTGWLGDGTALTPLTRWAIARAIQEAATQACKALSDEAINEALRYDPETKRPAYPDAAAGKHFLVAGTKFRLQIKNQYNYDEQLIDGKPDPESLRHRSLVAEKEALADKSKLLTKQINTCEETIKFNHPNMKPTNESTITISYMQK